MLSQASSQGKQPVTHELCAGKQLSSVTAALRACRGRGCGGRLLTHTHTHTHGKFSDVYQMQLLLTAKILVPGTYL